VHRAEDGVVNATKVVPESVTKALEGGGREMLLSWVDVRFHRFAELLLGYPIFGLYLLLVLVCIDGWQILCYKSEYHVFDL
jgi:hypothetical protein